MLYVGIDQHRKQLTVSVRDESGNVILRRQVSTEWKKVTSLRVVTTCLATLRLITQRFTV
jgi:predicted NBD/HSP70 family sugar kinase